MSLLAVGFALLVSCDAIALERNAKLRQATNYSVCSLNASDTNIAGRLHEI
ncbi:hypothetical protein [Nostoc sp.]|uniref:hypothetical protein n=1 Tax=Nostoc sp. TaxID=1180 RepID=UPI002FF760BB